MISTLQLRWQLLNPHGSRGGSLAGSPKSETAAVVTSQSGIQQQDSPTATAGASEQQLQQEQNKDPTQKVAFCRIQWDEFKWVGAGCEGNNETDYN